MQVSAVREVWNSQNCTYIYRDITCAEALLQRALMKWLSKAIQALTAIGWALTESRWVELGVIVLVWHQVRCSFFSMRYPTETWSFIRNETKWDMRDQRARAITEEKENPHAPWEAGLLLPPFRISNTMPTCSPEESIRVIESNLLFYSEQDFPITIPATDSLFLFALDCFFPMVSFPV